MAAIADYREHVNLALMQGAELSSDLLEGTGKGMRHITVKTLAEIKAKELTRLVREAGALAAERPRRKNRRTAKSAMNPCMAKPHGPARYRSRGRT